MFETSSNINYQHIAFYVLETLLVHFRSKKKQERNSLKYVGASSTIYFLAVY